MRKPRAASLIYALIIITILMIVAGSLAASFVRTSQRNHDLFMSTQAYYAGRAAMEVAFSEVGAHDIGYESAGLVTGEVGFDTNGDGTDDVTGEYQFWAKAKPLAWQTDGSTTCNTLTASACYFVPMPGTGDAGDSCNFESPDGSWDTDDDDKCNWNKIYQSESISVPLFYDGATSPFSGTEEFILRLRTPGGETLSASTSDVIAGWQFEGDCPDGYGGTYKCYLKPYQGDMFGMSWIDVDLINAKNLLDYIIIDGQGPGGVTEINSGIVGGKSEKDIRDFLDETENVNFKLVVTGDLRDSVDPTQEIPYLEYQIITNDEIISDNKIVYSAQGSAEGKLGVYTRDIQATQGLGSSSVINFALQN